MHAVLIWYYMKGQDISSLKIYICTNKSKTLIWQLTGKQGSNWSFGQVGHNDTVSNQVGMMFLRFFKVV